ncbi:nitrilase/cyanide hydratase and apolipoprotein N-acyltransferase [Caballeronia fortuita]|uniref:Nitrilase/cyanide hydratase and apolipoprotein N-acyltransferase n=1 Tax=Caballeronia fortuita TaxID=1777138 RepID=A0A158CTZ7_9BURK|nr:nitrilase-related carbon-nitrogen hydrolase [Caballeronia fortuita]SAK85798.1 nitrilase/cyanide hydratase and apolipoprotein N-acyltransferase [Caballeronia fortuita]
MNDPKSGIANKPYIAACVQATPIVYDVEATLHKTADLASDAAATGAKLAVFPEAFISAYPRGSAFGTVIGNRSDAGRAEFRRYHESAIEVPGPVVSTLAKISNKTGIDIVIGVIERDGGTLYCSVLFFDAIRGYLGKRRKLMPTGAERLVWGFGDGSTMPVFETSRGRVGAVICWENYMPMARAAMYAHRIQIYCAPTADPRPTWLPSMQHIAMEGRCFVLSTNQFNRSHDFPRDFVSTLPSDPDAIVCRGGSCIIDPLGRVLAGPLWNEEGIITAEIDLGKITEAMYDFDPIGHYSRPDVFNLTVDTSPKPAVRFSCRITDWERS